MLRLDARTLQSLRIVLLKTLHSDSDIQEDQGLLGDIHQTSHEIKHQNWFLFASLTSFCVFSTPTRHARVKGAGWHASVLGRMLRGSQHRICVFLLLAEPLYLYLLLLDRDWWDGGVVCFSSFTSWHLLDQHRIVQRKLNKDIKRPQRVLGSSWAPYRTCVALIP